MSTETKTANQSGNLADAKRNVTVISTRGEKKVIEYTGTDWGGLKRSLQDNGYLLDKMKAVEGNTKHTLEHDQAVVPEGNFTLFLMPLQSKSGGEARDKVKAFAAENKEGVKAHFGNWTILKEDELAAKLKSYKHKKASAAPAKASKATPAKKEAPKKTTAPKATATAKPAKTAAAKETSVATPAKEKEEDTNRDYNKDLRDLAYGFKDVDRNRL